ncbi:Holliday junction resolvase RuvX [Pelagibacteraceae bacterium]|nr:Holliday junction resolvase RuvX [Pelagibacteraceae bacterium]
MNDQINLIDGLNTSQILVGLDLGTKTIGVAVSDRTKIIASPLSTIRRKGTNKDLIIMEDILNEYEIGGFVLGLPLSLNNSENKQSQLVRDFNINLQTFFKKPSVLWDERYSSDVIFKEMRKAELSKTKIKSKLDQQSAAYILQGYLDRYRNN